MASTNKPLRLATLPLYGILVTEKSVIFGRRRLAKTHYAKFLIPRVIESRLPVELIDQIIEDLVDLDLVEMSSLWRTFKGRKFQRDIKFQLPLVGGTEAEGAAGKELDLLNGIALCGKVVVAKSDGASMKYVHISASANKPNLAELHPGPAPPIGPALHFADGHLKVHCHPGTETAVSREHVQIQPRSKKRQAARLVQVDGIEDAIKNWDQETAEHYVKFLKLQVVSMYGEDKGQKLIPRFRLLQSVEWT
jgi:hypothetical protein